jgi:IclR family pca regulon transcriptional regulator
MGIEFAMRRTPDKSETLEKGLRIWELFSGDETGFSLAEIARRVAINKTSVLRYLATFCELGYLQKDEKTRLYKIGVRTMAMSYGFLQRADIVQFVKPLVDEVHKRYDLHIDVGILQGDSIYLVYRRESKDTLAFRHFTTGSGLYYLATGKAAMAYRDETELKALLNHLQLEPKTGRTITNRKRLLQELVEIRRRGYSINDEEFVPGLVAIGAPLFNLHTSKVVGGVSFDSSTTQFSIEELEDRHAALLMKLAKKISAALSQ